MTSMAALESRINGYVILAFCFEKLTWVSKLTLYFSAWNSLSSISSDFVGLE